MPKGRLLVGIDVGTEKICTIISSVNPETGKVNVIGVAAHPSKGIRKSQIVDIEDAIEAITESVEAAERMAGFNIDTAFVSISGTHIASQNSKGVVAVSEPDGEIVTEDVERVIEAARAISLPASREILHVIPKDFVVDSQEGIKNPIGMTGVRLEAEAHIVTAASTAAKNLTRCLHETGIEVEELVFSGLASSYSTISETERELGVVLVDIGAGSTSLSVFVEGALTHSAVLPVGAKHITNDLAIGLRVSLESAEKIKKLLSEKNQKVAVPKASETRKERLERKRKEDELDLSKLNLPEQLASVSRKFVVEGIIKPRLKEMFELIGQQLQTSGYASMTPAGVIVTGGGAETIGMVEVGKKVLSMPVKVGTPTGLSGLVDEIEQPAFATSMGLIFYASKLGESRGQARSMPSFDPGLLKKLPIEPLLRKAKQIFQSFLP